MVVSLPKVTQQVKSRATIQSQVYLTPKYLRLCKNNTLLLKYPCPKEKIRKTLKNHM